MLLLDSLEDLLVTCSVVCCHSDIQSQGSSC